MEQSTKVGGGGTTPSGSREGSSKPPKAEGSMVTSTGEQKKVSPAGSLSSVGGAVGGVGTEVAMADLSLGERHSSQPPESSPFKRGHIFRDTTGKKSPGNPLTKRKDRKPVGAEVPHVDMSLVVASGQTIPSWRVCAVFKKMSEVYIPKTKETDSIILQSLFIGLMHGMGVMCISHECLMSSHKQLVEGDPGPLRALNTAMSGFEGLISASKLTFEKEGGHTLDELRSKLLIGGTNFSDWGTSPQTKHVNTALHGKERRIDLRKVHGQINMVGFLGMKFGQQLLKQFPHLVTPEWWSTAMGRAFVAAVSCDDPAKAMKAVAEVVKEPGFQELCNEIEIRIGKGKKGAAVTAGLKDLV